MVKTMVQIYTDDKKQLQLLKISTNAKNLPSVLKIAINLLKKQVEAEDGFE
jgi:hypothetical protein